MRRRHTGIVDARRIGFAIFLLAGAIFLALMVLSILRVLAAFALLVALLVGLPLWLYGSFEQWRRR